MRKRLAVVLLALLTTLGVFVAAAAPAGAAPSGNTLGQKKIAVSGFVDGAPATGTFRPERAVQNGNGIDLVGRLQMKSDKGNLNAKNVAVPVVLPTPEAARAAAAPGDVTTQAIC